MTRKTVPGLVLLLVLSWARLAAAQETGAVNERWEQVLHRLHSDEVSERQAAAHSIREMILMNRLSRGKEPDTNTPEMQRRIRVMLQRIEDRNEDQEVREQLVHALVDLEAGVPGAIELLKRIAVDETEREGLRATIVMLFRDLAGPDRATPVIIHTAESGNAIVRANALQQLTGLEIETDLLLDLLTKGVADSSPLVRQTAALQAVFLMSTDPRAVPLVIQGLADPDTAVQMNILGSVARLDPPPKELTETLERLVTSEERSMQVIAAVTLMLVSDEFRKYERIPLQALRADDSSIRAVSAQWLGHLKRPAPEVVEALTEATNDPDARVRVHAAHAVAKNARDPAPYAEILVHALASEDEQVRNWGILYLRTLHLRSGGGVLAKLLESEDANVRAAAVVALPNVEPYPTAAVNLALTALDDEDSGVRLAAVAALGAVVEHADDADRVVKRLEQLVESSEEAREVRLLAQQLLKDMQKGD